MATSLLANNARFRRSFEKIEKAIGVDNLIEIQKRSYNAFLQSDVDPGERVVRGLQAVFDSVFPIQDFNQTASLQFVSYTFEKPKYEVDECRQRGMTYSAPLKVVKPQPVAENESKEQVGMRKIHDTYTHGLENYPLC